MSLFCCDELRRRQLKGSPLNGIDYLEVLDRDAFSSPDRQRTLFIHLINPLGSSLEPANVRIDGGERIRGLVATKVNTTSDDRVLAVTVSQPGDFSTYTLRFVRSAASDEPPPGFDPLAVAVDFSFKVECPSDFDCRSTRLCPPEAAASPEIDYVAKDYASFRRLMLDRLAAVLPQWQERNPADLGITLVELLAYVGDQLSYQQDAVATEAYLGTARRRVSVRRHARLVDYFMHDGGNARAWVQVEVAGADRVLLPERTRLLSRGAQWPRRLTPDLLPRALQQEPVVFETMRAALLFEAHNEIRFYTWGDERCCLPRGATRATLADDPERRLRLCAGDVLVFEEIIGPTTGLAADADPRRRHAVRLTRVHPAAQSVVDADGRESNRLPGALVEDPLIADRAVVEIEWAEEDALPIAFCLSSVTDHAHGAARHDQVSVARGNIVLADHGLTVGDEVLGTAPPPARHVLAPSGADRCAERHRIAVPARFAPILQHRPLTHAASLDDAASASRAMHWSTGDLMPAIALTGDLADRKTTWQPRRDLLATDGNDKAFVVEVEHDGTGSIRFGDGEHGQRPAPGTAFTAHYRIGNGTAGNIGSDALWHVVSADAGIVGVRNPLPAQGGIEPETVEEVRQRAPHAFRTQQRAVTAADYAEVMQRDARIQRAAAALRWTGSWHTVFLTIDPIGGRVLDRAVERELEAHVDRYRMAGHDIEIDDPVFVSLELELHVCVRPDYFRAEVRQTLLDLFSNRVLSDGRRALFHPDNFSFGQTVFLSRLYAAAQNVPGVISAHFTTFKRRGSIDNSAVDTGFIRFGRTEIAQLDNDSNFAERGVFRLTIGGGK